MQSAFNPHLPDGPWTVSHSVFKRKKNNQNIIIQTIQKTEMTKTHLCVSNSICIHELFKL